MTAAGISIHAVDVAAGRPAKGLAVRLLQTGPDGERELACGRCGATGAFDHPTAQGDGITAGAYVAEFLVGEFYADAKDGTHSPGFLQTVRFHFVISDAQQHYHLPFKFTAWGYSLFRGGL